MVGEKALVVDFLAVNSNAMQAIYHYPLYVSFSIHGVSYLRVGDIAWVLGD